ncbi:MAG: hypothetical protein FWE21_02705 [Defluviitaleaceae bacterium]|nr:hypothetical protein [Defluviitaleaceae bacterium]
MRFKNRIFAGVFAAAMAFSSVSAFAADANEQIGFETNYSLVNKVASITDACIVIVSSLNGAEVNPFIHNQIKVSIQTGDASHAIDIMAQHGLALTVKTPVNAHGVDTRLFPEEIFDITQSSFHQFRYNNNPRYGADVSVITHGRVRVDGNGFVHGIGFPSVSFNATQTFGFRTEFSNVSAGWQGSGGRSISVTGSFRTTIVASFVIGATGVEFAPRSFNHRKF